MLRFFFLNFLLLALIFSCSTALSQDRNFARTYQSITLPKGLKDIEVWNTYRTGRDYYFRRIDQRVEFEVGLTDKLQTALYLNASHIAAYNTVITGNSVVGEIKSESEFSLSSEWKWRLSSADANAVGFALYGEITLAPKETELEGKIILDKRAEKNIFALNLVGELEMEAEVENGEAEMETEAFIFETDLAYMYMLKNNFGLGLELRNHNEIADSEWESSALFGGPTLFFSGSKYFLILNILPQLVNLKKPEGVSDSLDLLGHEKAEVRLLLGFGL